MYKLIFLFVAMVTPAVASAATQSVCPKIAADTVKLMRGDLSSSVEVKSTEKAAVVR